MVKERILFSAENKENNKTTTTTTSATTTTTTTTETNIFLKSVLYIYFDLYISN